MKRSKIMVEKYSRNAVFLLFYVSRDFLYGESKM